MRNFINMAINYPLFVSFGTLGVLLTIGMTALSPSGAGVAATIFNALLFYTLVCHIQLRDAYHKQEEAAIELASLYVDKTASLAVLAKKLTGVDALLEENKRLQADNHSLRDDAYLHETSYKLLQSQYTEAANGLAYRGEALGSLQDRLNELQNMVDINNEIHSDIISKMDTQNSTIVDLIGENQKLEAKLEKFSTWLEQVPFEADDNEPERSDCYSNRVETVDDYDFSRNGNGEEGV